MKRAYALLLTLLLLGTTATADVLIEPSDDFYRTHAEECEYLDRSYTANGKEGYVALYQSPWVTARSCAAGGSTVGHGWPWRRRIARSSEAGWSSPSVSRWPTTSPLKRSMGESLYPMTVPWIPISQILRMWCYGPIPVPGRSPGQRQTPGGSGKTSRPPRHFPNAGKTVRAVCGGS